MNRIMKFWERIVDDASRMTAEEKAAVKVKLQELLDKL